MEMEIVTNKKKEKGAACGELLVRPTAIGPLALKYKKKQ